nr:MarR family transcriptional regulator [Motilibacter deserti]
MPVLTVLKRELARSVPETLLPGLGALSVLSLEGPLRPSVLAERLSVDVSVASRQAAHLASLGLVERLPDPGDRRSHQLRITADGRARLESVRGALAEKLAQRLDKWEQRDAETLVRLLSCLRRTAEGTTAAPPAAPVPTTGALVGSIAAQGERA